MNALVCFACVLNIASALRQPPDYEIKYRQIDKFVLSLGDTDAEMVKEAQDDHLQAKLTRFHRYFLRRVEAGERPQVWEVVKAGVVDEGTYPDSPLDIAMNQKHLRQIERQQRWRDRYLGLPQDKPMSVDHKRGAETTGETEKTVTVASSDKSLGLDYENMLNSIEQNKTFKYEEAKTSGKGQKVVGDEIDEMLNEPRTNCSRFDGIGAKALRCTWELWKTSGGKAAALNKLCTVLAIWTLLYCCIAVPVWCMKGWGCCCCPTAFCRPEKTIRELQLFIATNPPGVLSDPETGQQHNYVASKREVDLYDKLCRGLMTL